MQFDAGVRLLAGPREDVSSMRELPQVVQIPSSSKGLNDGGLVMQSHLCMSHAACAAGPADGLPVICDGKVEGHRMFPLQNA